MSEIPKDVSVLLFALGPKVHAYKASIVGLLAVASLVLGIIGAAIDNSLGLGATNWLLLAIALLVWSIADWFAAYFGAKEGYVR